MAANDYYRDSYREEQYSQSFRPPYPAANGSSSHMPTSYDHLYSSEAINPSYSADELSSPSPSLRPYHPGRQPRPHLASQYRDSIPLKDGAAIQTTTGDWQNQATQYPPSPDSQTEPHLLPRPAAKKKKGFFSGKIPWVVYTVTVVQIAVFVAEIIKNSIITGSPIMIHPQFNPMIGPSTYVLINMGARFVPCMRVTPGVQDSTVPVNWPCPNTTTSDPNADSNHCDLKGLCGFSGFNDDHPNQWFRFIIPMFLHAGIIHIGFNLLLQLTMGREMEQAIGSLRFGLVYFSSGIFGFVLGGNFAATAIASTGASGCLFGILALVLLDLIYGWNERRNPVRDLMWIIADIVVSFVLGLLPGLDNFSHIGGFLMGLVGGICLLHSPNVLRQRIGDPGATSYRNVGSEPDILNPKSTAAGPTTAQPADVAAFAKQPVGFFKGRKPLWWAWWLLRAGALIGILVGFILLLNNFYNGRHTCSWCKYLSCLPINNWCSIGNLQLTNTTTSNSRRDLLRSGSVLVTDLWQMADMH